MIGQENNELFEDHPVYRISNNKSKEWIGIVFWFKPWNKYVFSTKESCVFDITCLHDVLDFMEKVVKLRCL